jgi:hypothetical protein
MNLDLVGGPAGAAVTRPEPEKVADLTIEVNFIQ